MRIFLNFLLSRIGYLSHYLIFPCSLCRYKQIELQNCILEENKYVNMYALNYNNGIAENENDN